VADVFINVLHIAPRQHNIRGNTHNAAQPYSLQTNIIQSFPIQYMSGPSIPMPHGCHGKGIKAASMHIVE